jgi:Flavin-binding monooxygenase-like
MHFEIGCLGAKWNTSTNLWDVSFRDSCAKIEYIRSANVFISAVGGISYPRDVKFPGIETFKGNMFHTAQWGHTINYTGKPMTVIGNDCSAAQLVQKSWRELPSSNSTLEALNSTMNGRTVISRRLRSGASNMFHYGSVGTDYRSSWLMITLSPHIFQARTQEAKGQRWKTTRRSTSLRRRPTSITIY